MFMIHLDGWCCRLFDPTSLGGVVCMIHLLAWVGDQIPPLRCLFSATTPMQVPVRLLRPKNLRTFIKCPKNLRTFIKCPKNQSIKDPFIKCPKNQSFFYQMSLGPRDQINLIFVSIKYRKKKSYIKNSCNFS